MYWPDDGGVHGKFCTAAYSTGMDSFGVGAGDARVCHCSMITAASIIAPIIAEFGLNDPQRALVVISIASGATLLSHVNDSGFWLVGKYLG